MKVAACVIFTLLAVFAMNTEIDARPDGLSSGPVNCEGTYDWRCPQAMCGPKGIAGSTPQDNTKPYPECCGRLQCIQ